MKIVFIDPPGVTYGLNTGIGYLCGALKKHGYNDIRVVDFNNMPGNTKKRLEAVGDANIVGISIKSLTLKSAIELAKAVKKTNPKALIIAGGAHITLDAKHFLQECAEFDACIVGESESSVVKLVSGSAYETIPGFYYRRDGEVVVPKLPQERVSELDALPFPDYDSFDSVAERGIDEYPLVTSRGCPYQCIYCSVRNVMGAAWKMRSSENVIEELKRVKAKYGYLKKFRIVDDNFTLDMERAKTLCRMITTEKLTFGWSCPNGVRADRLDPELLGLMKESGCFSISIGVESLDEDVFNSINKGERLEDIVKAAKMIKEVGIRLEGFFIIGLPGSTYAKDMNTVKKARELGFAFMSWSVLVPYPGTPVWKWVAENDGKTVRILRDWKEGFHVGLNPKPVFETTDYTAKERTAAYRKAYLSSLKLRDLPRLVKVILKGLV